jgi:hypothetical protein
MDGTGERLFPLSCIEFHDQSIAVDLARSDPGDRGTRCNRWIAANLTGPRRSNRFEIQGNSVRTLHSVAAVSWVAMLLDSRSPCVDAYQASLKVSALLFVWNGRHPQGEREQAAASETASLLPASSPWQACTAEYPNPRADSGREKDRMRGK